MDQFMNNPQLMALLQDPEVMAMLQEPGMMEKMQEMMSNPQAALSDPRMMSLMNRMMGGMGGGGSPSGSNGGSYGMNTGGNTTATDLGKMQQVTSTSQYNYKVKEAMAAKRPVVVQFTMQGCRPCQMLKPEMVKLSNSNPDISFILVDNRQCPEVVEDLGIQGFPTVIFYSTLDGKLNKNDTVVGMDMGSIQANINRLQGDLEQKKKKALFEPFKHLPIREGELTYFKQIQWDKLTSKVTSLMNDPQCPSALYRPFTDSANDLAENYSTPKEFLTHFTELVTFLSSFNTTSMQPIKPAFMKVLNILMEWPESEWNIALHVIRMGAFHNDFAANLAKNQCKGQYNNIIQRLCMMANEKTSTSLNAVLVTRALCSFFEKKILTKMVLTGIDELLGLITLLTLGHGEDNNVLTSALALLLNTSYMIYCYAPSQSENLQKQKVMVDYQKTIVTNIIETLPISIDESKPDGIYKLLIAVGTTLFPYYLMIKTATGAGNQVKAADLEIIKCLNDIDISAQLKTWKEALPDNKNIQGAVGEVEMILKEIFGAK